MKAPLGRGQRTPSSEHVILHSIKSKGFAVSEGKTRLQEAEVSLQLHAQGEEAKVEEEDRLKRTKSVIEEAILCLI